MENSRFKFRAWDGENIIDDVTPYFTGEGILCVGRDGYDRTAYDIRTSIDCIALSIMQYTGIKDKNGVEIYEGDIVRATFGKHSKLNEYGEWAGKIFFNCGSFDIDGEWCVALNALGDTTFEVIGNIYEHSHLLDNN